MHIQSGLSLSLPWPRTLLFSIWKLEEPANWALVYFPHPNHKELAKTQISSHDPQLQLSHVHTQPAGESLSSLSRAYKAFMVGLALNLHAFFLQGSTRFQLYWMIWRGLSPGSSHVFSHPHLACPLDHQNVSQSSSRPCSVFGSLALWSPPQAIFALPLSALSLVFPLCLFLPHSTWCIV